MIPPVASATFFGCVDFVFIGMQPSMPTCLAACFAVEIHVPKKAEKSGKFCGAFQASAFL